jgi:hypothetical protein
MTIMASTTTPTVGRSHDWWLFSAPLDLAAFLGSAVLALALLGVGRAAGVLHDETPEWAWVPLILLIDVAHVYATAFRVYFDREELSRRWLLYAAVPLCGFLLGVAVYTEYGPGLFWRALAYLAVFHFVRQQYGWVALYRAKLGERGALGKWIDTAAIYLATIYPLVYWHAHLPRSFWWFRDGDFRAVPMIFANVLLPCYCLALLAYAVKSVRGWMVGRPNPGKDIVLVTTAICWYVGIILFNSDYAFSVTNVIIHGVPYMVLIYWYMRSRALQGEVSKAWSPWRAALLLIATIWLLAYVEELVWYRAVWADRPWLFGSAWHAESSHGWLVPLLAVPQLTHYVLDGFIWRRQNNPNLNLFQRRSAARRH